MKTVLVANRKGGCGKTTIATTLAVALADGGWKVGLADADRQASTTRWLKRRPRGAVALQGLDWQTERGFGKAPASLDWLVIDAPGALDSDGAQVLVAQSRALIVPVLPSFFDADSTKRFLREIQEIKRVRKGKVDIMLVANRLRWRVRAAARLEAFFEKVGQAPVARISERAAYADLAEEGLSVFDKPQSAYRGARAQWEPLIRALV